MRLDPQNNAAQNAPKTCFEQSAKKSTGISGLQLFCVCTLSSWLLLIPNNFSCTMTAVFSLWLYGSIMEAREENVEIDLVYETN